MTKTICFASKKGGVSKTTSAIITSLILAQKHKTLLIDLDSQNALTSFFFEDYNDIAGKTIYEAAKEDILFRDAIHKINENLDIIPSKLEFEEIDSWSRTGKEFLLKDGLASLSGYDYVVIDTPPSLRTETVMGLVAANCVIIAARLEKMDIRAIDFTISKINKQIKKHFNNSLSEIYILPTQYNYQNRTVNDVALESLKGEYGKMVIDVSIPFSAAISKFNFIGFSKEGKLNEFSEYAKLVERIK